MNLGSIRLRFSREYVEFGKDLIKVIVSYTPISGVMDTVNFSHKWFVKRKVHERVASRIKVQNRRYQFNRKLSARRNS